MKNILSITSRQNEQIRLTVQIKNNPTAEQFIIEGSKFVHDTPLSDMLQLFTTCPQKHRQLVQDCLKNDISVYEITGAVMDKICDAASGQELLAVVKKHPISCPPKLVLLDDIQDCGNAGTIIRTAAAFGFGCVFSEHSANPFSGKTVRSSAGAIFQCYVTRENLYQRILQLKQQQYTILSSELHTSAVSIHQCPTYPNPAILIGNEGAGVHRELSALAQEKVYIPINNTESLNASVAAGIFMYTFQ